VSEAFETSPNGFLERFVPPNPQTPSHGLTLTLLAGTLPPQISPSKSLISRFHSLLSMRPFLCFPPQFANDSTIAPHSVSFDILNTHFTLLLNRLDTQFRLVETCSSGDISEFEAFFFFSSPVSVPRHYLHIGCHSLYRHVRGVIVCPGLYCLAIYFLLEVRGRGEISSAAQRGHIGITKSPSPLVSRRRFS
jgi:hypothetical protein